MKLQSVSIILALGFVAEMADGLCLVRNTTTPNQYFYQCFRSIDYSAELNRSPIDVYGHTVSNSEIKVIRNGSYSRLGKSLEILIVFYCGVERIEENAFDGLSRLTALVLPGNKLEIIKSSWFKGLTSLTVVSLPSNRIKHVEDDFFAILPPLDVLDISNNKLTCLPTASFGNFSTTQFYSKHNRLSWVCRVLIFDWLKDNDVRGDYLNLGNMDPPYDLAKLCLTEMQRPRLDEKYLNECAEDMTRRLLPSNGSYDYTGWEVCEFLKRKPSWVVSFLDCTK